MTEPPDDAQTPLRVLILEDEEDDALIIRRQLGKGDLEFTSLWVDHRDAFQAALAEFKPDLILSDFSLPGFDGLAALRLARAQGYQSPFIVVTGSLDEETAVECIKAGADDYVLKDRLARLGPAVRGALDMQCIRRAAAAMEAARHEADARYREMFVTNQAVKWVIDPATGAIIDVNPAACKFYGYSREQLLTMHVPDVNIASPEELQRKMAEAVKNQLFYCEFKHKLASGEIRDVEIYTNPIAIGGRSLLHSIIFDVTERRAAQEKLRRQLKYAEALNDLAQTVLREERKEDIMRAVVRSIGEASGVDRAGIFEVDFTLGTASGIYEWQLPELDGEPVCQAIYKVEMFTSGLHEMRRKREPLVSHADQPHPLLVKDGAADLIHGELKNLSVLWLPFMFEPDGFYLIVLFQTRCYRNWQPEEFAFLNGAATLVGLALQKSRLIEGKPVKKASV